MELRTARQVANITQEELAARADVDVTFISRLETDGPGPRPNYYVLVRIARALNLTPDQLWPVPAPPPRRLRPAKVAR